MRFHSIRVQRRSSATVRTAEHASPVPGSTSPYHNHLNKLAETISFDFDRYRLTDTAAFQNV
jgi:hypothetical protein